MKNRAELYASGIDKLLKYKFAQKRMTGWFEYQELKMEVRRKFANPDAPEHQPAILCECIRRMKLSIPAGSVIAGTQDDAFSPSYALINPAFQVETFAGYCDPVAIYDDLEPDAEFPRERVERSAVTTAKRRSSKRWHRSTPAPENSRRRSPSSSNR